MKHVEDQQEVDKVAALDTIEIKRKLEKNKIIRRYNYHYLLGLKVRMRRNDCPSCVPQYYLSRLLL